MGLSVNYSAIRQRIRRLPEMVDIAAETIRKRDAYKMVQYYREGITNGNFPFPSLAPSTIRQKRRKGYAKPENPLYAGGKEIANTLVRNYRVYKMRDGYIVKHTNVKHHESKLSVNHIAKIQEYGLVVNNGQALIRIPPRPAIHMAFKRVMQELSAKDPAKEVRQAVTRYLKGKGDDGLKAIFKTAREYEVKYGTAD